MRVTACQISKMSTPQPHKPPSCLSCVCCLFLTIGPPILCLFSLLDAASKIDLPKCEIQALSLSCFNLTQNRTLTAAWTLSIRANESTHTPSSLTYRRLNLSISYLGQVLASEALPTFRQDGTEAVTIEANATSSMIGLGPRAYGGLEAELRLRGEAEFDVALDGPVRVCLEIIGVKVKLGRCVTDEYFHYKFPPRAVVFPCGSSPLLS